MMRKLAVVGVALCLMAQVAVAATNEQSSTSFWSDAGYGTLAVFSNVLYMPAKIVYAAIGTITGGLAYVVTVGDTVAANKVWSPSVGGTYVLTPSMLRGDDPILFSGASYSGSDY